MDDGAASVVAILMTDVEPAVRLNAALEAAGGGPAPPPKPAAAARDRAARVARARMERNRGGFEPDLDW